MAEVDAQELLTVARGGSMVCGCGRALQPVIEDGRQVGLTHTAAEDDDHHMAFWGGLTVELPEAAE